MKIRSMIGLAVGSWLVGACGEGASAGSLGATADAGAGGDAAGQPTGDSGTTSTDAATAQDAATTADAGDTSIDPLVVGYTWTYDVTDLGNYPLCPAGSHQGRVLGEGDKDGLHAFQVSSLCANAGDFYYAVAGDVVQWDDQGTWLLALDAPVQEGHSWTNGVTSYTWHDAGTVMVPAGTFDRCWKAQDDAGPSYTIFCRGIGPVHWHFVDPTGAGYEALLTSKSF